MKLEPKASMVSKDIGIAHHNFYSSERKNNCKKARLLFSTPHLTIVYSQSGFSSFETRSKSQAKVSQRYFQQNTVNQKQDKRTRSNECPESQLLIQSPLTTISKTHRHDERCLARSRLDHDIQVGTLCKSERQPHRLFSTPSKDQSHLPNQKPLPSKPHKRSDRYPADWFDNPRNAD
ncbi:hypothetical protein BDR22DRAFT_466471 [Usnea florida]